MIDERRVRDLSSLSSREKVEFMLMLCVGLLGELEHFRRASKEMEKLFETYDLALRRIRLWLRGELNDAEALRYPVYNSDGTDIADTTLRLRALLPDADIEILGSTITTSLLYVAFLQYTRDGVELLPHPYQGPMDEEELAENLEIDLGNYSSALQAKFDQIWEARFRPD